MVIWDPTRDSGDQGPFANVLADITFAVNGTTTPTTPARSDEQGFYQVTLDPGAYTVCYSTLTCFDFTLPAGTIRIDDDFLNGGWHLGAGPATGDIGPDAGI